MPARGPDANGEPSTRERIVTAATTLFVERGYHGVSMREIGEALGLSKAALYHHFRDKQELLLEVLLAGVEQAGGIVAAAASHAGARARVRALLEGIARNRLQQRSVMRLAEREAVHLPEAARAAMLTAYRAKFLAPIEQLLTEGQAAGELDAAADPAWLARALLALAQPLLSVGEADSERFVAATLDLFFEGAGGLVQVANTASERTRRDPSRP